MGRKSSRAPVTGLAEYIGSHIVDRLLDRKYDVRVKDKRRVR
jgi:nucleoside-diphosphate-sugar epimerase